MTTTIQQFENGANEMIEMLFSDKKKLQAAWVAIIEEMPEELRKDFLALQTEQKKVLAQRLINNVVFHAGLQKAFPNA